MGARGASRQDRRPGGIPVGWALPEGPGGMVPVGVPGGSDAHGGVLAGWVSTGEVPPGWVPIRGVPAAPLTRSWWAKPARKLSR